MEETLVADKRAIASRLGIEERSLSDALLHRLSTDELFRHHVDVCSDDPEMAAMLLSPYLDHGPVEECRSTVELSASALLAVGKWAKTGFANVPDAIYERRLATCNKCPHIRTVPERHVLYSVLSRLTGSVEVCDLCGCMVKTKARLSTEICPDTSVGIGGRWSEDGDANNP